MLFTAYAAHLDSEQRFIYLASDEGLFYKLDIKTSSEMNWAPIQQIHPVGQSMCMIGSININDEENHDVLFYSGESANSQIIAVCPFSILLHSFLTNKKKKK